jgi:Holliday junction resolvase RusA-like endonuclease
VIGKPEPRGSKVAQPMYDKIKGPDGKPVINPKTGKPAFRPRLDSYGRVMTFIRDDNPASGPWMKKVARSAREVMGDRPPFDGPVKLHIRFYLERPAYHFGTGKNAGRLKERYMNAHHTVRPDRLKLARAIEDALTGIFYVDDAQTVGGPPEKFYAAPGDSQRVEIEMIMPPVQIVQEQRSLIEH